jgi:hypothetical protein
MFYILFLIFIAVRFDNRGGGGKNYDLDHGEGGLMISRRI